MSEAVTVTLSDASFEAKQNTLTKFTMNFGAPVKNLTVNDVEVIRLLEAGSSVYEYPQVVKSVTLADNGLSATVEMFTGFQNNVNYVIKANGFDDYTMTASAGVPVAMTISSNKDAVSPFVTAGTNQKLYYKLYDANNVDVTTGNETVLFNTESFATDGSYYVAGDVIWFMKAGLSTTVVAEYQGRFENGVQVGKVSAKFDFHSVDAVPVTLKGVTDATVTSFGNDKTLSLPKNDVATLKVKVAKSQGDVVEITANNQLIDGIGNITFTDTTPDILAIDTATMTLVPRNQGIASIIVNLKTMDSNGTEVETPIGVVTITVVAERSLSTVTVDKPLATVGSGTDFPTEDIKLIAKDQYGKEVTINSVTFTGVNEAANNVISGVTWNPESNDSKLIRLNGDILSGALGTAKAIQLTYRAKVNDSKEVSFSVLVKTVDETQNSFVSIETTGGFGEIARTVDSKTAKSVTFTAYVTNNGIKVRTQEVAKYPANIANATPSSYYFKVLKNGEDVTSKVIDTGVGAIINFSSLDPVNNGAVTGSAVKYDLGAGTYEFRLFQYMELSNGAKAMVPQRSVSGVTTCNTGSYTMVAKVNNEVSVVSQSSIRDCFKFNNTKGSDAGATPYFVNYENDATGTVYVKSVTFYDEIAPGEYAPYTVNMQGKAAVIYKR